MADPNLDLKRVFRGTSLDGWIEAARVRSLDEFNGSQMTENRKEEKRDAV